MGRLLGSALAVLLALWGLGSPGQQAAPESFARLMLSGPIEALASTRITVQGQAIKLTGDTLLKGLDDRGRVVDLRSRDLRKNAEVTVLAQDRKGSPTAILVLLGRGFTLRGTVTDFRMGRRGYVTALTLDGRYRVEVEDADFGEGVTSGSGSPEGGGPGGGDGPTVDVGDEVVLQGIVRDGKFVAVLGSVIPQEDGDDRDDSAASAVAFRRRSPAHRRPSGGMLRPRPSPRPAR
ncbi:MAG: DUF5666 domain-containing protein [Acidobacteriota bacterium]